MPEQDLSALSAHEMERRLRVYPQVIELLSTLMRSSPEGIDVAIDQALERMGQFCEAGHVFVLRRQSRNGAEFFERTHGWYAAGAVTPSPWRADLPGALIDPWLQRLASDECVDTPRAELLSDVLQKQGVGSLLLVPMQAEGAFSGILGFMAGQARQVFPSAEVLMLRSVADAIATQLARADNTAEIARTQAVLVEANNRLMSTLRALPDLILELDGDGRYIDVHTADPGQMMAPPDSVIGRTDAEALPPEIAEINRRAMAEVDAKGRSGPHPFWVDTQRGRRRYVMTASRRPPLKPGETPGYVFVSRDVTEEWRLQREAERLSLIARRMTELVLVVDIDNRIEWVNPAFEARTGWRLDEVRGRTPPEVLNAPDTDRAEVARLAVGIAAGQAVRAELLSRTKDGEDFWTDVDIQPLHDENGELTGFVSIETDITARKAHAAALEQLAGEAQAARARLEMAVEALPDAFVYFDAEGRLVLSNARYRSLQSADEPGLPLFPAGREAAQHTEMSQERQMPDGRWLRLIERITPDGGRVGMGIDITAVKEAERRLIDIIHGAEAGTWEWHVPNGTNIINARWAEMVGYTLDELTPMTIEIWRDLVHPADLAAAETKLARVFAKEVNQFEYQLRMRHRAGHWVQVMSRGRVARWSPDGSPEMMAGVHLDITALKRAEARLAQIIDAATAGTWEFDYREGQQQINHHWAEMLGYSFEELAVRPGFGFRELLHPEDLAMLERLHAERTLRDETHFANEIRMRHRDGHWVWILSRGQVVDRDDQGRAIRSAGIHLDISDRKQLEAQLTAERDYLSRLMETSTSGIAALDGQGQIIFANREAERILGLSVADMVGRLHDAPEWQIRTLEGDAADSADLPFSRAMATGETVRDVRLAIAWPDGTRRILSLNAAPVTAEGLEARVVCSINDITEQVAAESALRATAERAEAANQAKSRFLANMSHEIRTPLNGVLGMAQVLEDELTEPRHRHILGVIRESGEMLLGVLNDILDMSKIEAGKLTLEDVVFDPAGLANRIEAMHQPVAAAKGLVFELRLGVGATGLRRGDPGRLSQILHNLVGNAVKFTEVGRVTVEMDAAPGGVLGIVVRDTGIGMTRSQLERVFEDFEQADGTVTRRFGGTGLGMSIVRRLVNLMGGAVEISSEPGAGTVVQLRLPLPYAPGEAPGTVQPAALPSNRSLAGLRVLAADDNVTNRLILKSMLARLEIDVVLVTDGRAAVDAWAPGIFDAYLLDISMPELDGISTLAELRRREADAGQPPVPALAITANALSHQVAEYAQAGFVGHLGKPFRREDLAAALAATRVGA